MNTAAQLLKARTHLEFDAEAHEYRYAGKRLPSVTQIIGAVIPRKHNPGDWYLQRGRAIHQAIHLLSNDSLDWDSVDERIKPRLQAFQAFCAETRFIVQASEIAMVSTRLQYAGTIDALMGPDEIANPTLVDFKNTIEPTATLQLGGYSLLINECDGSVMQRACLVELRDSGRYSCKWFNGRELRQAEQQFKAIFTTYNFMQQNNLLEGRTQQ